MKIAIFIHFEWQNPFWAILSKFESQNFCKSSFILNLSFCKSKVPIFFFCYFFQFLACTKLKLLINQYHSMTSSEQIKVTIHKDKQNLTTSAGVEKFWECCLPVLNLLSSPMYPLLCGNFRVRMT